MKKLFIILFILCLCSPAFAGIYGNIEIGQPIGESYYYANGIDKQDYKNTYFSNLMLGYKNFLFDLLEYRIYAGIFTWSEGQIQNYSGYPFETIYAFGSKIVFKGMYLRYHHFCAHPVSHDDVTFGSFQNYYYPIDNKSWVTKITSVTIGYEFEIK